MRVHLLPVLLLAACEADLGTTGQALSGGGLLPDIVEEIPQHLQIQNEHQREMLRFTSTHWNVGEGPLQVRGAGNVAPCVLDGVAYEQCTFANQEILDGDGAVVATQPAGVAVFHPEHNHWHQNDVASFFVRAGSPTGPVVSAGVKITYCLIDLDKSDWIHANNTRVYWDCNGDVQGISVGWGDEYHQSTHGQELEVTGLPAGIYYLTHEVDPTDHWAELDEDNNQSWVKFQLSRKGANASVKVLGHSPCDEITCGNTANK